MYLVKPRSSLSDILIECVSFSASDEPFTDLSMHPSGHIYADVESEGNCSDFLKATTYSRKIVSRRAWDLIKNFKLSSDIIGTQIDVRSKHASDEYLLVTSNNHVEILDKEKADAHFVDGVLAWVDRWVIDGSKVPDSDVVFSGVEWFFSEELAEMIKGSNLAGFEFVGVEVS